MKPINLIVLFVFVVACTKELDYDFNHDSKLVINCLFTPGQPFEFRISRTAAMENKIDGSDFEYILKLYKNDELIVDTISDLTNLVLNVYPSINAVYQVECSSKNYLTVTATDSLPEYVKLQKIESIYPIGVDAYGDEYGKLQATFKDAIGVNNYYELLVADYSTFDYKQKDKVLINEGDLDYEPDFVFFSDELIDGEQYTLDVIGVGYLYDESTDRGCLTLKSISEAYYNYQKYYTRHVFNQQVQIVDFYDFVYRGEPIDMYTNVVNGYGIFAGYQSSEKYAE